MDDIVNGFSIYHDLLLTSKTSSAATTGKSVESLRSGETISWKSRSSRKKNNTKDHRSNSRCVLIDKELSDVSISSKTPLLSSDKNIKRKDSNSITSSKIDYQRNKIGMEDKQEIPKPIPGKIIEKPSSPTDRSLSETNVTNSQISNTTSSVKHSNRIKNSVDIVEKTKQSSKQYSYIPIDDQKIINEPAAASLPGSSDDNIHSLVEEKNSRTCFNELKQNRLNSKRNSEASINDKNNKQHKISGEIIDQPPIPNEDSLSGTIDDDIQSLSEDSWIEPSTKPPDNSKESIDILEENTLISKSSNEISQKDKIDGIHTIPCEIIDEAYLDNDSFFSGTSRSSSPKSVINTKESEDMSERIKISSKHNSEISLKNHEEVIRNDFNDSTLISRKRSKEEQCSYISSQLETFLRENEITKDDFLSMQRYFDTVHHFRHSRPVYVSDYCQFLTEQKKEKFILFANIFNECAIEAMTEDEANEIQVILKRYEEKLREDNYRTLNNSNEIIEKDEKERNTSDAEEEENNYLTESDDESGLNEDNYQSINTKIENGNTNIDKDSLDNDKNTAGRDNFEKCEEFDFSESFQRLFRASVVDIGKDDIERLKSLVAKYDVIKKPEQIKVVNVVETEDINENEDFDFSISFRSLFRNSICEMKEENIDDFQRLVEKLEVSDRNRILSEDEEIEARNMSVIRKVSRHSLGDITEVYNNYNQREMNKNDNLERSDLSIDKDNRNAMDSDSSDSAIEDERMLAFRNLFKNSIGRITEDDLDKISKLLEQHENDLTDKRD